MNWKSIFISFITFSTIELILFISKGYWAVSSIVWALVDLNFMNCALKYQNKLNLIETLNILSFAIHESIKLNTNWKTNFPTKQQNTLLLAYFLYHHRYFVMQIPKFIKPNCMLEFQSQTFSSYHCLFFVFSDESLTCNVCDRAFHCHRQLASHQQKKRHFG